MPINTEHMDPDLIRMMEEMPDHCDLGELCDCGRHKNLKTSKRAPHVSFPKTKRSSEPMLSDYQLTFKPGVARPRSSKRPLPVPRDPNPPAMSLSTIQRSDFKNNGVVERVRPFLKEDEYVHDNNNLDFTSYYAQEFTNKPLPKGETLARPATQNRYLRATSSKFDSRTTNKESFQEWKRQPQFAFRELPSFAGSILYPQKPEQIMSITQQSFPGVYPEGRIEHGKGYANNIKIEGDIDLLTTNNATYKGEMGPRALQFIRKPTNNFNRRGKGIGKSQTQLDFGAKRIQRTRPIPPAPETIAIGHDNRTHFGTEQQTNFMGHDVNQNPIPKPFNPGEKKYERPTEPIDLVTLTQNDFKPHDIKEAYMPKARIQPTRLAEDLPKFDDRTTYKTLHQNWGPQAPPRIRHGDFHEAYKYVPPMDKYDINSTTRAVFTPKKSEPVKTYRPEENMIDSSAKHDFRTVNRETYKPVKVPMCKAQIYLMKQELRKQFREFQSSRQEQRVEAK